MKAKLCGFEKDNGDMVLEFVLSLEQPESVVLGSEWEITPAQPAETSVSNNSEVER